MPRYDLPKAAPAPLRLVQEFVNTVDREHGREWLSTPDELEAWYRDRGIEVVGSASEVDLRRAVELREALRALAAANNGGAHGEEAVAVVNHALRAGRVEIELDETARPRLVSRAESIDGATGRLLGILIDAIRDGTWARLKACRQCGWLFFDYSSNRSATWCSMAICGNRLKTRAYRRRQAARG